MAAKQPNILFIMSDDHASHAMGCYGSRLNQTPHLDRIAEGGMRFDNCFCTNSICTPSRATILTGTYSHVNGCTTLATPIDNRLLTFPKLLQTVGYRTAIFGKWHLGTEPQNCPTGFDSWAVLPGQGLYHDPLFIEKASGGRRQRNVPGYATEIITDLCIDWLRRRDKSRPFCLLCHHKAPHRPWRPDEKHARMYEQTEIPVPETFDDDYANRACAAAAATMRIGLDMTPEDLKKPVPEGLSRNEQKLWKYQQYIKDYLRCVASIDDNVGRLLDELDGQKLTDETMVIYTSDQGMFLGDHGWYDKRFMYEESLRMPFIIRYPLEIKAGTVNKEMIVNADFAPTFLDFAGIDIPDEFQGRSFRSLLQGTTPQDWQQSMYYRYWMHLAHHHVYAHYGVRTHRYKLIYYYADWLGQPGSIDDPRPPEWELFDLEKDPYELNNVYSIPAYAHVVTDLKDELHSLQTRLGDQPFPQE